MKTKDENTGNNQLNLNVIIDPMVYINDHIKKGRYGDYPYLKTFTYLVISIGTEYRKNLLRLENENIDEKILLDLYSLNEKMIMFPNKELLDECVKVFLIDLESQVLDFIKEGKRQVEYDRFLLLMETITCDFIYSSIERVVDQITLYMEFCNVNNS